MTRSPSLLLAALIATLPAAAQAVQTPPEATLQPTDPNDPVEQLGRYLRILSTSPRDLDALKGAGRAALDVGDANAAVGFYARAEEIAPRDGAIKAGIASALVQMEQPKEALKLFEQAVSLGVAPAVVAEDRGLAYDLRGDNRRAQADYALALRTRPDDETVRRLALSQAMSGDRPAALATLDPLLRKQDIAAWRASTFVLALTGDTKGAVERVGLLMQPQQANAMAPFLGKLAALKPAQQAQAVHFGHLPSDGRASEGTTLAAADIPAPNADRAPAPAGAPLGGVARSSFGDAFAAAAAAAPASRAPRRRPGIDPSGKPAETAQAAAPDSAPPPAETTRPAAKEARRAAAAVPVIAAPPARLASAPLIIRPPAPAPAAAPSAALSGSAPSVSAIGPVDPRFTDRPVLAAVTPTDLPPSSVATPPPVEPAPAPVAEEPRATVERDAISAVPAASAAAKPSRNVKTPARAEVTKRTGDAAGADGTKLADAKIDKTKRAAADKLGKEKPSAQSEKAGKATRTAEVKTDKAKRSAEAKTEKDKQTIDARTVAARRTADAAKADKAKRAAEDAKADKTEKAKLAAASRKEPQRYWVQVATGARKADLSKAWAKVKAQYPALMAGKTPSTTPLRFTNRLLVGPFKSSDEAQAFVNATGKAGFGTSPFASAPGQVVERVGGK